MYNSIKESSKGTYSNSWTHWKKFSIEFGTDPHMHTTPSHFKPDGDFKFNMKEYCILSFMSHLRINIGVTPKTICNYISGVKWYLNQSNIDTQFIDNSKAIKSTRTGMEIIYRSTMPESDKRTLPLTTEMIKTIIDTLFNGTSLESKGIRTACQIVFTFLMIIGEYIKMWYI